MLFEGSEQLLSIIRKAFAVGFGNPCLSLTKALELMSNFCPLDIPKRLHSWRNELAVMVYTMTTWLSRAGCATSLSNHNGITRTAGENNIVLIQIGTCMTVDHQPRSFKGSCQMATRSSLKVQLIQSWHTASPKSCQQTVSLHTDATELPFQISLTYWNLPWRCSLGGWVLTRKGFTYGLRSTGNVHGTT